MGGGGGCPGPRRLRRWIGCTPRSDKLKLLKSAAGRGHLGSKRHPFRRHKIRIPGHIRGGHAPAHSDYYFLEAFVSVLPGGTPESRIPKTVYACWLPPLYTSHGIAESEPVQVAAQVRLRMEETNPGTFIAESRPSCSLEHKGRAQGLSNAYPPSTIFQPSNPTHNAASLQCALQTPNFCWYVKERRCTEKTRPQCSCSGTCVAVTFVLDCREDVLHIRPTDHCFFAGNVPTGALQPVKVSEKARIVRRRREKTVLCLASKAPGNWKYDMLAMGICASRPVARGDADVGPSRGAPAERDPTSASRGRHLAGGKGCPNAISALARVLGQGFRMEERTSAHGKCTVARGWRGHSGAKGDHLDARKAVLRHDGTPSGSDIASWWHPQKVGAKEFLATVKFPQKSNFGALEGQFSTNRPREHRKISPSARFRRRMEETNIDANGGHSASKKTCIQARWHPIRVGYGALVAPPGSRISEILVDFGPQPAPPAPPPQASLSITITAGDGREGGAVTRLRARPHTSPQSQPASEARTIAELSWRQDAPLLAAVLVRSRAVLAVSTMHCVAHTAAIVAHRCVSLGLGPEIVEAAVGGVSRVVLAQQQCPRGPVRHQRLRAPLPRKDSVLAARLQWLVNDVPSSPSSARTSTSRSPACSPPRGTSATSRSPACSPPRGTSATSRSPACPPPRGISATARSPACSPPRGTSATLRSPACAPPRGTSATSRSPVCSPPRGTSATARSPACAPSCGTSATSRSPACSPPRGTSATSRSATCGVTTTTRRVRFRDGDPGEPDWHPDDDPWGQEPPDDGVEGCLNAAELRAISYRVCAHIIEAEKGTVSPGDSEWR
eukprot:gene4541-biopygen11505